MYLKSSLLSCRALCLVNPDTLYEDDIYAFFSKKAAPMNCNAESGCLHLKTKRRLTRQKVKLHWKSLTTSQQSRHHVSRRCLFVLFHES